MSDLPTKITLGAVLALLTAYLGISTLGASGGDWALALNAVVAVVVAAWIGWLIRDCDEP